MEKIKTKREKYQLKRYFDIVWNYAKKHKMLLITADLCIKISYAVSVLLPLNLQFLTDHLLYLGDLENSDYSAIWISIRNYAILFGVATIFNFIYGFAWQSLHNKLVVNVKQDMFVKIINAKSFVLNNMNIGDTISRINYDSDQFLNLIQRNGMHFVNSFIMIISIIAIMSRIDAALTLIIAMAALLPIIVNEYLKCITKSNKVATK